jgi:hypothetical protein
VKRGRQFSALPWHPCYCDPPCGIISLASLQPPARNITAGRTSYTGSNVRHPTVATLQSLAMKTQGFASYRLPTRARPFEIVRGWKGSRIVRCIVVMPESEFYGPYPQTQTYALRFVEICERRVKFRDLIEHKFHTLSQALLHQFTHTLTTRHHRHHNDQ